MTGTITQHELHQATSQQPRYIETTIEVDHPYHKYGAGCFRVVSERPIGQIGDRVEFGASCELLPKGDR